MEVACVRHRRNRPVASLMLAATCLPCMPALARVQYGRNCTTCHTVMAPNPDSPGLVGFSGTADPDESGTGATDLGTLPVFTVPRGVAIDLQVLIDFLAVPAPTRYALSLSGMENGGVVGNGVLSFQADPDWTMQTGVFVPDPSRPYYTLPTNAQASFVYFAPQSHTFTMFVNAASDIDFYALQFTVAGITGTDRFGAARSFYLQVIPEPRSVILCVFALLTLARCGRRRARAPLPDG